MIFDEKKNRNDVKLYACKAREVTIPALQAELELAAEDAAIRRPRPRAAGHSE